MTTASAFGKKKSTTAVRADAKPPPREPVPEIAPSPAEDSVPEIESNFGAGLARIPFFTLGLMVSLSIIYQFSGPLIGPGGLTRTAVLAHGEWWRVFTAPVLHKEENDLISNLIVLFIVGWVFESVVGRTWFAALFAISAVGGSIGALAVNPPALVSTGATGASLGLLAAALVCSFIFESEQLRKRMQRVSLQLLAAPLLIALLPSVYLDIMQIDFGSQIGGAVTGSVMGFLLRALWREDVATPRGAQAALMIAAAGGLLSICGFAFIALRQFGI